MNESMHACAHACTHTWSSGAPRASMGVHERSSNHINTEKAKPILAPVKSYYPRPADIAPGAVWPFFSYQPLNYETSRSTCATMTCTTCIIIFYESVEFSCTCLILSKAAWPRKLDGNMRLQLQLLYATWSWTRTMNSNQFHTTDTNKNDQCSLSTATCQSQCNV